MGHQRFRRILVFLFAISCVSGGCADHRADRGAADYAATASVVRSETWAASAANDSGRTVTEVFPLGANEYLGVDRRAALIFRFSLDGTSGAAAGGRGEGPGDLGSPCCLAYSVGDSSKIWLFEQRNRRYSEFDVSTATPTFVRSVAAPAGNPLGSVVVDARGVFTQVSISGGATDSTSRYVIVRVDSTGRMLSGDTLPPLAGGRVDIAWLRRPAGQGLWTAIGIVRPFGSVELAAMAGDGAVARGLSGRYLIELRPRGGTVLMVGDSSVNGPALSPREADSARANLAEQAKNAGMALQSLPFGVPKQKTPLKGLSFDATGRLWVWLSTTDGASNAADVYSGTGKLIGRFMWPAEITPYFSSLHGLEGIGWSSEDSGFRLLHKLTFVKPTTPRE